LGTCGTIEFDTFEIYFPERLPEVAEKRYKYSNEPEGAFLVLQELSGANNMAA
jgi:hypothetical protein